MLQFGFSTRVPSYDKIRLVFGIFDRHCPRHVQVGRKPTPSEATPIEALYRAWAKASAANPTGGIEAARAMFEHWGDVTAEPEGVSYRAAEHAGQQALWANPKHGAQERVLLCLHGGGYVLGSPQSHRKLYGHFAKAAGCPALILDYRRAPEHPYPAQLEDVVGAYEHLLTMTSTRPDQIVLLGDSAGGALAISALLLIRDRKRPAPAGAIALAPYLDTEALGRSYDTNATHDLLGSRDATLHFIDLFLGPDGDRRDPLANPLHADPAGLPPILLQTGGYDVLLDDSTRFAAIAHAAGVDVTLQITPNQQHVFHFMAGRHSDADRAIQAAAAWLRAIGFSTEPSP